MFHFRYIITSLCEDCYNPPSVVTLVFWVGYFNSALNPLIYAYFNREFRVAFKRTLQSCCQTTARVVWCRRRRSRQDPVTCSTASSEIHMNNHLRVCDINNGSKKLSYNVSEGETINLQCEAVI